MQYLGGKFKIRSQVIAYLNSVRFDRPYIEPFVGAAWIVSGMPGERYASDLSEDLILLWQEIQRGWIPPEYVSREEYYKSKNSPPSALRGFIGYGCSYSGKWFGGYAEPNPKNPHGYARNTKNSLARKAPLIAGVTFLHCSYDFWDTSIEDHLIYCDPPYVNTTKYRFDFDHAKFWNWARTMGKRNTVVVSEYSAPEDIKCVLEIQTKTDMRGANQARVERLFQV